MNPKPFAITVGMFLLFSSIALAVPGQPHQFYGTVTVNGITAADGTVVSAKINGIEVANTTASGGKYGYSPIFYISDPNSIRSGQEITFFVSGVNTGVTAFFVSGAITKLDFSVSVAGGTAENTTNTTNTTTTTTTTTVTSSGSGSGSALISTGATVTGGVIQTEQACQERWLCSDWLECDNGIQTRLCADQSECGTNNNEPFSSQPCSSAEMNQDTQSAQTAAITSFFLGVTTFDLVVGIVAGAVIAAIIIYAVLKKRRKGSKKKGAFSLNALPSQVFNDSKKETPSGDAGPSQATDQQY